MICIYTGSKQEVNAVLCEIEKEDDVEPPRKKAKKDCDKENKSKSKQASKPKKGTQQRRKNGETKASGAIIIVGVADKLDGYEQQNRSSNTSPPLPTGDDGKQKTKSTPLLASGVPLPPTHPPPFNSLCLTMTYPFHLCLLSLPRLMTRSLTHHMKTMYLIQVSKIKK